MKKDASHIKQIKVVSNTHWDREFRRSFERTRRRLMTMMDVTLDILDKDPEYHSFTLDGHSIMLDDYLEMRPERKPLVERLVKSGRLVAGPYYTLAEEFSIGQEPVIRNLVWGRRTVEKYGGECGTVAYTPSSWGQTGQLPQILSDFGLEKMMFYRGISHHEADAEWIWEAPDGTKVLASRFAVYARYNWYYQVHRAVTVGRVFQKDWKWGEFDETPFRFSDGLAGEDLAFDILSPKARYSPEGLKKAIEDMVAREGAHFTTEVFLAMHGHDISVAHPLESRIIKDAQKLFKGKYSIEHCSLEEFWNEAEKRLGAAKLPVLKGERRAYLKQGMWTFLFPGTVSARTYLKQADFSATARLVNFAEPLSALACALGAEPPKRYLDRAWSVLLSNHTHDANGGCAPDCVCLDMEARYRNATDIADIVTEDSMAHVVKGLSPKGLSKEEMLLVVFNPLPFERDATILVDLEIPAVHKAKAAKLASDADPAPERQAVSFEKSSSFVDSIWDVPTILESSRVKFLARLKSLPALGYRTYRIVPEGAELRHSSSLATGPNSMENETLAATMNADGTLDVLHKPTKRLYSKLNYLIDQGECGNAWRHLPPAFDKVCCSLGVPARVSCVESGPLAAALRAEYEFMVPADYGDGKTRSADLVPLKVSMECRLLKGSSRIQVKATVDNAAKDHWLRACFPTDMKTDVSVSDSHFDAIERPIEIPDSTGWVEQAFGTHPLRTFVALDDGKDCVSVQPEGLFEYEVMDSARKEIALTLIRACRIKLAVSEEKLTELPDSGIQCPGVQTFRYSIAFHKAPWAKAALFEEAVAGFTPPRAAMAGRGQGKLPLESCLLGIKPGAVQVSCVKPADDKDGIIVRLFNPLESAEEAVLYFGVPVKSAETCKMDESRLESVKLQQGRIRLKVPKKKIMTLRVRV